MQHMDLRTGAEARTFVGMDKPVPFASGAVINWRGFQSKEPGHWVAICDSLKLTAQAQTWAELLATCDEIIQELFKDLHGAGDLDKFLSSRGWKTLSRLPRGTKLHFDIPVNVSPEAPLSGKHRASAR